MKTKNYGVIYTHSGNEFLADIQATDTKDAKQRLNSFKSNPFTFISSEAVKGNSALVHYVYLNGSNSVAVVAPNVKTSKVMLRDLSYNGQVIGETVIEFSVPRFVPLALLGPVLNGICHLGTFINKLRR